jgi:hypothetical protein
MRHIHLSRRKDRAATHLDVVGKDATRFSMDLLADAVAAADKRTRATGKDTSTMKQVKELDKTVEYFVDSQMRITSQLLRIIVKLTRSRRRCVILHIGDDD